MNARKIAIFFLIVLGGILLGFPLLAEDSRSYEFENLDITAKVLVDGSMLVTEERTVNFQEGEFHGLYQWIKTERGLVIDEVVVEEKGQPYEFNPGSTYGPTGTYLVKKEADQIYIDWSFDATAPQRRTFVLKYRVFNAVKLYSDVAELYYQFIGDEWEKPVQQVSVDLFLPAGAQKSEIRAWGHGPLHGEVQIVNSQNVKWQIAPLPEKTFLEGRVTFPPQLVADMSTIREDRERLPEILAEESAWAEQANRQRKTGIVNIIGALLLTLGVIIYTVSLHIRYGREYKPEFVGDYYRELPVGFPPALVGYLWRFGKTEAADLMATILDLARRGYMRIEEYATEEGLIFKRKGKGYSLIKNVEKCKGAKELLKPSEEFLLNFLFVHVSRIDRVSFTEIEDYTKRDSQYFYHSFWEQWVALVKKEAEELNFFDQDAVAKGWQMTGLGALALVVVAVLSFFSKFMIIMVAAIVGTVILVLSAAFIRRRSRTAVEDYSKLKAFRRFLMDFSNMDKSDIPELAIWEHFLVYAVPLGIADKVMEQLNLVFPNMEDDHYRFGQNWYYYGAGSQLIQAESDLSSGFSGLLASFHGVSTEIENAVKTVQNASSGQGGGGGFSGGGGFGGGGGGVR